MAERRQPKPAPKRAAKKPSAGAAAVKPRSVKTAALKPKGKATPEGSGPRSRARKDATPKQVAAERSGVAEEKSRLRRVSADELLPALRQAVSSAVLHQAVTRHMANRRAGTADTKKRDEVAGGGRKPWRQKGTGRARHGSIRSPIWRKGGVVFGPHPRSYALGMNRKSRRKALAAAVTAKATSGELYLLDAADLRPQKTKSMLALLRPAGEAKNARDRVLLVVHPDGDSNATALALCSRNLPRASVHVVAEVSVYSVLAHDRVIVTQKAYDALAEACSA